MLDAKFATHGTGTEHGTTLVLYWINDIYMSPILFHMTYVLILKKSPHLKLNRLNDATY